MNRKNRREFIKRGFIQAICVLFGIDVFGNRTKQPSFPENLKHKNGRVDWDKVRNQFLLEPGRSYFNFGSLGLSPKVVISKMEDRLRSLESRGTSGYNSSDKLRKTLSKFLNTSSLEIGLTRNTTEGMNIVARGLMLKKGDEVLISNCEHIGGAACWLQLQKEIGIKLKVIELDYSGEKNQEIITKAISNKTKVLSISHILSSTGTVLPVKEIINYCRKMKVISIVDGAQAFGMIPVDLSNISPDFYISSGHKWMCGPKGTGFVYANEKSYKSLQPGFVGAYSDITFNLSKCILEIKNNISHIEYGTRNMSIYDGFNSAVLFINTIGIENIFTRGKKMADYFLNKIVTHQNITVLSSLNNDFSSSIVTFRIENTNCSLFINDLLINHKKALRGVHENNLNAIRASFSLQNDYQEIDELVTLILAQANK